MQSKQLWNMRKVKSTGRHIVFSEKLGEIKYFEGKKEAMEFKAKMNEAQKIQRQIDRLQKKLCDALGEEDVS